MSKYKAAEKTFEFFYDRLVRGYKSVMGRNPEGLDLIKIKQEAKTKQIEANKVIEVDFGEPFAELIKKGEITKGTAPKTPPYTPSKSQTDFELQEKFRVNNQQAVEGFEKRNFLSKMKTQYEKSVMDKTTNMPGKDNSNYEPLQKSLRDSQDALTALKIVERKGGSLDEQTKLFDTLRTKNIKKPSSVKLTDTIKFTEDMATGGRAGYYGGGMTNMVEPDLSDIGHGGESLNARTRVMSPGSQATTSTGLNYLLGEDNDNTRVPFNKGKLAKKAVDEGRRGFMKAAGATTAGIAALKTGLLGFGEKVAPIAKETVAAAGEAFKGVPPYFMKLVNKIRKLGDDVTETGALSERQNVKTYKDYTLTEDTATGRLEIQKIKNAPGEEFGKDNFGNGLSEEVYMSYQPGEVLEGAGKMKPLKTADEYEEGTAYLRNDGPNTGDVYEEVSGVTDEIFEEVGEAIPEAIRKGQADGGRIGYNKGKIVKEGIEKLIKAGEGKFTKAQYLIERIKNTIKGSPDDKYVQETFPGFIDELTANPDLAKNENVFKELGGDLPEGQQIVVYGDDTLDFFTTSSGPQNIKKLETFMAKHDLPKDEALKIMKMEPNDQVMELTRTKHLKKKRTDNSSGGLAAMLGE